jgi:hypothetical protein
MEAVADPEVLRVARMCLPEEVRLLARAFRRVLTTATTIIASPAVAGWRLRRCVAGLCFGAPHSSSIRRATPPVTAARVRSSAGPPLTIDPFAYGGVLGAACAAML